MPPTDDEIRKMAKARVDFRQHLVTYLLVNVFLAALWFYLREDGDGIRQYWPIWVHAGWGLGLLFNAYHAYGTGGADAVAREEAKLRQKYGRT